MSTHKNTIKSIGWDAAIDDAKRQIERLRGVIAACEEKKAKGEPWPGSDGYTVTQKAGTAGEAIPA